MLLIAEIILTIFAWRKGWKWLSLIPMAAALFIGLLLGAGIGASGGDPMSVKGFGVFLDIVAVIALIVMVTKSPKSQDKIDPNQDLNK